MRYQYLCPEGHVSEASHSMDEFKPEWEGANPRVNVCSCGLDAVQAFLTTPPFAIDFYGDSTRGGGYNIGAGRYFKNKQERKEWMRQQGVTEVAPEDRAKQEAYLADLREARADGAPDPEHPGEANTRARRAEVVARNMAKRREPAARLASEVQDWTREQAVNVLAKEEGWTVEEGRAYVNNEPLPKRELPTIRTTPISTHSGAPVAVPLET